MSNKQKVLPDIIPNIKFNLLAQEQFTNDKGIIFCHYAAIPSPIGLKGRGEYRRPDILDTISSNGFIYTKVGEFVGTITGNSKKHQDIEGGIYDSSISRLVLPKFYRDKPEEEISLLPGDRIYARDIEVKVSNFQKAEYNPKGVDYLQFPVKCVSILIDSQNISYTYKRDFKEDKDGNIKWITGRKNPGIDVDTGRGRIYSIRYKYIAYWYVSRLINEIRITNTDTAENPERLPYHVEIQREYIYRNKIRGDAQNTDLENHDERTVEKPVENIDPNKYEVQVDIKNLE